MSNLLGTAYVMVRANLQQLAPDLRRVGGAVRSHIGSQLSGFGNMAAGFASGYTAVNLVSGAIANFRHEIDESVLAIKEQTLADIKLKASLESTAHAAGLSYEALKNHASELQYATGIGDEAIEEFQTRLLMFRNVQGEVFKRATKIATDWSAKFGTDIPSVAMKLGRALNDPANRMSLLNRATGELTVSQQKLIKELQGAGDMAGAQAKLMDFLEQKLGGVAAKSMTQMKLLKIQKDELRELLGEEAKPWKEAGARFGVAAESTFIGAAKDSGGFINQISKAWLADRLQTLEELKRAQDDFAKSTGIAGTANAWFWKSLAEATAIRDSRVTEEELDALRGKPSKMKEPNDPLKAAARELTKAAKDRNAVEGFFSIAELTQKFQEASLKSKNDKMLALTEQMVNLQEQTLHAIQDGGGMDDGAGIEVQ